MALWLVRTGRHGEHEQRFLDNKRIYLTWGGLEYDLSKIPQQRDLYELMQKIYQEASVGKLRNHTGQIWSFAHRMKPGDWVIVPSKTRPAINIAEIVGPYVNDPNAENPFYHYREVKWIEKDIPRSVFDQDLLYSFGAFMTVCEIKRNDAEKRIRAMAATGWNAGVISKAVLPKATHEEEIESGEGAADLEEIARDQIAQLIIQKFKGHGLARLVEAVLRAQGYTTYLSPEGPDKGVDILAAPGPLGFGKPRICVQVKSGDSPVDSPTLNQLIGSMQNVQAEQGLLVSWGGFKSSVDKEIPAQFFRVRLWDQKILVEQLLEHYDKLDADLRAELPFKQIWTVAMTDEDE